MALVTHTLNGMYNGVSQQPAPLRMDNQFQRQSNFSSDIVDGVLKRPNTEFVRHLISGTTDNAKVHTINRAIDEKYKVILTGNPETPIEIYDLEGNAFSVTYDNQATKDYCTSTTPRKDIKCLSLAEETFIVNNNVEVEQLYLKTPVLKKYVMAWIKRGLPEVTYTLRIFDINGNLIAEADYEAEPSESQVVETTKTDEIVDALVSQLTPSLPNSDYVLETDSSTIFFYYKGTDKPFNEVKIKVECEDSFGDTAFTAINTRITDFADLPPRGREYYPIAVTGNRGIEEGAFYVEYDKEEDIWLETRALYDHEGTLLPDSLDPATMPRIMKREGNTFHVSVAEWEENLVGDDKTSPMPSFVGEKINEIFFYRNRLGFLSRDNIILSSTESYFDLFPTTATNVLESDPIDISVMSKQVAELRHAIPFSRSLLVFSDQAQFAVGSAGTVLTPETITVDPSTYFESVPNCPPVGAGANIYFAIPRGNFTGIREYYVQPDSVTNDAQDTTAHVPRFIPSGVTTMASSSAYDTLFVFSEETPNILYVYKYQWAGEEKIQSAWFKWTFEDEVIIDIEVNDNYLFMITKQGNKVSMVRIDLRHVNDGQLPVKLYIDKKVHLQGTYDPVEDFTYFTLPYDDVSEDFVIISEITGMATNFVEKTAPNELRTRGEHTDIKYYIGKPYKSVLEYSRFYLTRENGTPDIQGKMQLKTLTIAFNNSGEFTLRVVPNSRDNVSKYIDNNPALQEYLDTDTIILNPHSGVVLGDAVLGTPPVLTGEHTFPVTTNARTAKIEIVAESYLPANFQLTAFEAEYNNRAQHI